MTNLNCAEEFYDLYAQVNELRQTSDPALIRAAVDADEGRKVPEPYPFRIVGGIQVREIGDE